MTDLFDDSNLFANPTVQAVGAVLVLCVLIAVGFYLVASFRDYAAQDQETDDDVLTNLQEMHRRGDISDQEFRRIKTITERTSSTSPSVNCSDSVDQSTSVTTNDD